MLVEDDAPSSAPLLEALSGAGFDADVVTRISEARALLVTEPYAAVVFHLNLPNDEYLAMTLRPHNACGTSLPLSILGPREIPRERLAMEALIARLKKPPLRTVSPAKSPLKLGNLELILDRRGSHILIEGTPHNISLTDLSILTLLLRRQGRVVSKVAMADHLKRGTSSVTHNAIEVYIHRLRKLLEDRGARVTIETVKGIGYLIRQKS